MGVFKASHVTVSIDRPPAEVYAFASNPVNLRRWASGLGRAVENVGGEWVADSPMGRVKVEFAQPNAYGVLDHDVTLPSGESVYNPMRVFPNNDGSEVVFTLYQRPQMSDEMFAEDEKAVRADLEKLKSVLEQ